MTLRELIAAHPDRFYPQTWYEGEAFMDAEAFPEDGLPNRVLALTRRDEAYYNAATLARLYVQSPNEPIWRRYLWTSDHDSQWQQVYIGDNGKGLEIHRHIHITDRFGVPHWR